MRQLFLILLAISVGLTAGRASCADALFPRPSRDALAKAEEKVRELYKADLAKAVKPKDKIALVEVLLRAANGVGQDDASRLVLWTMARDLAVDANDGQLSMKVVTGIVNRFQPDGPTDPKEQMEAGNTPWKEAETAPADKRLRLQIKAAEWYLRARPIVTGLDDILIKKRLDKVLSEKPPAEPEASASRKDGAVFLAELEPQEVSTEGTLKGEQQVGGRKLEHALFLHPPGRQGQQTSSHAAFHVDKQFSELSGGVGISDGVPRRTATPLTFRVVGDGKELWKSHPLQSRGDFERFSVSVSGVKKLELFVDCPGRTYYAQAVWADPLLRK